MKIIGLLVSNQVSNVLFLHIGLAKDRQYINVHAIKLTAENSVLLLPSMSF